MNLVGYTLFGKDMALDIKGGGVLLYVREVHSARAVKLDNQFPEQVGCKVKCSDSHELFVGVCYRTPSENVTALLSIIFSTLPSMVLLEVGRLVPTCLSH